VNVQGINSSLALPGTIVPRTASITDPNSPMLADESTQSLKDQFMKLMVEQLKNQDPMNPLDSKEFTAQLAQLNSLEQLMSINSVLEDQAQSGELGQATSLLGRYVEGIDADNNVVTGTVERVEMIDGQATLKIGDQLLLLSQVVTVTDGKE
jgi:flagellar basal-body rod modification protein FlgD